MLECCILTGTAPGCDSLEARDLLNCPNCNYLNPKSAMICMNCGTPLAQELKNPDARSRFLVEQFPHELTAELVAARQIVEAIRVTRRGLRLCNSFLVQRRVPSFSAVT